MAKATFSCASCGTSVQIIGRNRAEADRQAKWAVQSGKTCSACWRKERDAEHAAVSAAAAAHNAEIGLPALSGTPKQIAWAETIRSNTISAIGNCREEIISNLAKGLSEAGKDAALIEEARDVYALVLTRFRDETNAEAFISKGYHGRDEARQWVIERLVAAIREGAAPGLRDLV